LLQLWVIVRDAVARGLFNEARNAQDVAQTAANGGVGFTGVGPSGAGGNGEGGASSNGGGGGSYGGGHYIYDDSSNPGGGAVRMIWSATFPSGH
jgi:hypothetical protein